MLHRSILVACLIAVARHAGAAPAPRTDALASGGGENNDDVAPAEQQADQQAEQQAGQQAGQQQQQQASENTAVLMDRDAVSAEMLEKQGFLVPNEAWGSTTGSEFMVTPEKLQKMDAYPGVDYLGMGCERGPLSPLFALPCRPAPR